jgi:hypothetical protein
MPNAIFARWRASLRHETTERTIKPDRRQQQRQSAEECGERSEHALAHHGLIYLRRQSVDFDRDLAVYGGDSAMPITSKGWPSSEIALPAALPAAQPAKMHLSLWTIWI